MDPLESNLTTRPPTAEQPLLGLTLLLVEDSRFAAEGFRLLSLRSGARMRRAIGLAAARRHLSVYRPTAVLVDLGLPDGSGAQLIGEMARAQPRVHAIFGISGDPDGEAVALAAGADGFIAKPITSLAAFQAAILARLPLERQPPAPRALPSGLVSPDLFAFREDLAHALDVLTGAGDAAARRYVTQFLGSVARAAGDGPLLAASEQLASARARGRKGEAEAAALMQALRTRLAAARALH